MQGGRLRRYEKRACTKLLTPHHATSLALDEMTCKKHQAPLLYSGARSRSLVNYNMLYLLVQPSGQRAQGNMLI